MEEKNEKFELGWDFREACCQNNETGDPLPFLSLLDQMYQNDIKEAFRWACETNKVQVVEEMLGQSKFVKPEWDNYHAFYRAVCNRNVDIVEMFLDRNLIPVDNSRFQLALYTANEMRRRSEESFVNIPQGWTSKDIYWDTRYITTIQNNRQMSKTLVNLLSNYKGLVLE